MTIIICIENLVYDAGLTAERGLSIYIENDIGEKIIMDTGQSGAFHFNSRLMGINLAQVDALVLSHGHNDHTGGVDAFCRVNLKAPIYAKKEALYPKFFGNEYIGIPFDSSLIFEQLKVPKKVTEIAKDIFIVPKIKIFDSKDTYFNNMFTERDGIRKPDTFEDELFIVLKENNAISIISGCSHRGITNIIKSAKSHFKLPIRYIAGGFHLKENDESSLKYIGDYLEKQNFEKLILCHSAGINAYSYMKNRFGDSVDYAYTGYVFRF